MLFSFFSSLKVQPGLRSIVFYAYDESYTGADVQVQELDSKTLEELLASKNYVSKPKSLQSSYEFLELLDGRCDVKLNCDKQCSALPPKATPEVLKKTSSEKTPKNTKPTQPAPKPTTSVTASVKPATLKATANSEATKTVSTVKKRPDVPSKPKPDHDETTTVISIQPTISNETPEIPIQTQKPRVVHVAQAVPEKPASIHSKTPPADKRRSISNTVDNKVDNTIENPSAVSGKPNVPAQSETVSDAAVPVHAGSSAVITREKLESSKASTKFAGPTYLPQPTPPATTREPWTGTYKTFTGTFLQYQKIVVPTGTWKPRKKVCKNMKTLYST